MPTASAILLRLAEPVESAVGVGVVLLEVLEVLVGVVNEGRDIEGGSVWVGKIDVIVLTVNSKYSQGTRTNQAAYPFCGAVMAISWRINCVETFEGTNVIAN